MEVDAAGGKQATREVLGVCVCGKFPRRKLFRYAETANLSPGEGGGKLFTSGRGAQILREKPPASKRVFCPKEEY